VIRFWRELDAMKCINIAFAGYIKDAKRYDINTLMKKVDSFSMLIQEIDGATDEKELCDVLVTFCNNNGYKLPWKGEFDDFMSDRGNRLVFG
jgi:hypothetical protein